MRIQQVMAAALWTAVLACAAWLAAAHGRKEYAEFTPVEILDEFTPSLVEVVKETSVHRPGGCMIIKVSGEDVSYTLRFEGISWDPAMSAEQAFWLADLGPLSVNAVIRPGSEISRAVRRNLQRGLAAGAVFKESARAALAAG